jgi:transposase InsO family protein
MSRKPDGRYRYICHFVDHYSKFHFLYPIEHKTQENINWVLTMTFGIIGVPPILHSDNGSEFGGLEKVIDEWPGRGRVVHGRPRHPQSQGLVERYNACVEEKLGAYEANYVGGGQAPWHKWLPYIQCM